MIATTSRTHTPRLRTTGHAETADTTVTTRERARSQIALLCLQPGDRLLRTDRRTRQHRNTTHLTAQRADARHRTSHAPPLRAPQRLGLTRALNHPSHRPPSSAESRQVSRRLGLRSTSPQLAFILGPLPVAGSGWLPSPMFADRAAGPLQGRIAPFPSQARFRAAARPAVRALSTTGSPQGGNQT